MTRLGLCGFRMDSMDGPRALTNQVASYINGVAPSIEEKNEVITEVITTSCKRESNYVHHGWSADAVATISPWTQSRIDATNRCNMGGTWFTRRNLALRLRIQVLLEDLSPVPEFVAAIEEALTRPSLFEKFQAVYRALNRWGDVVPLEIEMGSSFSFTDTEANFALLPETTPFDNSNHVSKIKTANTIRKGTASYAEWDNGSWAMRDVPPTEWRVVRVGTIAPTINLLPDDLQARLTDLYAKKFSYVPPLMIDPIGYEHKVIDDAINASRTISTVEIHSTGHIIGLATKYLDGTMSQGGREVGNHHTFALNKGEHIIEMLTWFGGEWLHGIQFVTNTGRCSVVYGIFQGTPTISRSKGGLLVGFLTSSKKHSQWGYLITGVRGIWRYDLMPRVPKENDVYSDYYGDENHWRGFNDRGLIGNSNSMYISCVEVWSGASIDSIQFTYTNTDGGQNSKLKTVRHGGSGGIYHRFELGNGEHIVSISGRSDEKCIVQLCFVTGKGRISDAYGGGGGQAFSALSPVGESGDAMRLQYIIGKRYTLLTHVHKALNAKCVSGAFINNDQVTIHINYIQERGNNFDIESPMGDGRTEDNAPFPPGGATNPSEDSQILKNAGWLCGFRMDSMDGPRALANQIASYADGAALFVEEKDDIFTEVITTSRKRESNYVHQDATNWHNMGGNMITRRSLVVRLRAQVLLEDLSPVPEFVTAIEEALTRPSLFEKFQAVYRALNRWGDVVPLEIEMGSSLSFTDTEANFALLPDTTPLDNLNIISKIKTANIIRKGTASNAEWNDGSWATRDVPPAGWRVVRVGTIAPTINLLPDDLQARLTDLYAERFSYAPPLAIDQIGYEHKMSDDAINASRTISTVEIYGSAIIAGFVIKYLDGVISRGGREADNHHTFALNKGEHIIEMLTCPDGEWLRGIQFVTNTGRCSVVYGVFEGTPTVWKSKGGVLVGFSTTSKKHPQYDYYITGVRGIWRYDLMPRVPKENDVYSSYYGSTQRSKGFNDRGLIGNLSSLYISSVEVWSGAVIDSIQFTYTNTNGGPKNPLRHGGLGGNYHRFELRNGEHIVSISGRFNEKRIVQLCFGTSKGRISEVYGGVDGQKFSASSPVGESGDAMRLHYIIGKSDKELNGIMFAWTPELP